MAAAVRCGNSASLSLSHIRAAHAPHEWNPYRIDLENAQDVPYDELAPLLERIRAQKKEINTQMEELNKKEQEFSSLSDNMREGFIMLNSRCEVLAANRSACRILSIQNADIKGRNLLELSRDPELARLAPAACGGKKAAWRW